MVVVIHLDDLEAWPGSPQNLPEDPNIELALKKYQCFKFTLKIIM